MWVLVDKRACVVVGFDVVCTMSRMKKSYCCVSEVFVCMYFEHRIVFFCVIFVEC